MPRRKIALASEIRVEILVDCVLARQAAAIANRSIDLADLLADNNLKLVARPLSANYTRKAIKLALFARPLSLRLKRNRVTQ